MFVIWGTKYRESAIGFVADWCTSCGAVRKFSITEHYSVGHIYYIPLGSGTLHSTTKKCDTCSIETGCDRSAYERIAPDSVAASRTVDELAKSTNPKLVERLKAEQQADEALSLQIAEQGGGTEATIDPRLQRALTDLRGLGKQDADAAKYIDQLRAFSTLTAEGQLILLDEITEHVRSERQIVIALAFLRRTKPPGVALGCGAISLLGLTLLIWAIVQFLSDDTPVWQPIVGLVVFVALFVVGSVVQNNSTSKWARTKFIPELKRAKLDPQIVVGLLVGIGEATGDVDEGLKSLAESVDVIAEEALAEGLLQPATEGSAAP